MAMPKILPPVISRPLLLLFCLALLTLYRPGTVRAQGFPGWLPPMQFAGTYSYLRGKPDNPYPALNLSGASESLSFHVGRGFSAVAEAGEYRFTGLTKGLSSTMYTYLFGPRLTLRRFGRIVPYAQALAGGGRLNANSGGISAGENGLAIAAGGGVDVPLRGRFSLRAVQADYFLTRYGNETGASATQNHLRISAGIVVQFGRR